MANKTIGQLNAKTTPASADVFVLEDTEDTKKINYDALADAILNKITSKNYTVAGSSQTLINAINTLNSKTVHVNWGTTLSVTSTGTIHGILLLANYYYVQVWMPATSDVNIFVMSPSTTYAKTGQNSVSFGTTSTSTDYVLERTGNKSFTVTSPENNTLTWISY